MPRKLRSSSDKMSCVTAALTAAGSSLERASRSTGASWAPGIGIESIAAVALVVAKPILALALVLALAVVSVVLVAKLAVLAELVVELEEYTQPLKEALLGLSSSSRFFSSSSSAMTDANRATEEPAPPPLRFKTFLRVFLPLRAVLDADRFREVEADEEAEEDEVALLDAMERILDDSSAVGMIQWLRSASN